MKKKLGNKVIYGLLILLCIGVIAGCTMVLIEPDFGELFHTKKVSSVDRNSKEKVKVVTMEHTGDVISEIEARKLAKMQCKELGENVEESFLEVIKIDKKGELFYYITSARNSMQIDIASGKITKINSCMVEELEE